MKLWTKIRETAVRGRRTGLGFTGLADTIAMLGFRYDSDKALDQVEMIMQNIFKGQLDSTIDMAIERGEFPAINKGMEFCHTNYKSENQWYKKLSKEFPAEFSRMLQYGRRNISWSTVKIAAA